MAYSATFNFNPNRRSARGRRLLRSGIPWSRPASSRHLPPTVPRQSYANRQRYFYTYSYTDAHSDSYCYSNSDSNSNAKTNTHAESAPTPELVRLRGRGRA